jgi:hypothetical protein
MAPLLTPSDALAYLDQLSADVRTGAVLDIDGELLAGDPALAGPGRELLGAPDREVEVTTREGRLYGARSDTHAVVVACGPFALSGLQRHDLRTVLADLADRSR